MHMLWHRRGPRHALGASLYSFGNGWWGIPFGIIWTPIAIIKNLTGSSTILVEDLLRVPPPPPVGLQQAMAVGMKEATKELLLADSAVAINLETRSVRARYPSQAFRIG
jgi:hypothetical protein